ncbi:hypothetical protein AcW1_005717 [Taiwanofungus camphoratus]|nr:hypothetical protein AcW2_004479 [Antrodia cinnamomea]KAI0934073.1 hypothetical protein AcV5_006044 [Antrodia cinnamomea]KAI0950624.1 hypothetical protein AcV7_009028 [Antrodia cinnamomea]KAI0957267.1 hypothetical protein AcW1_005717 [Antrodia cinnamomea]
MASAVLQGAQKASVRSTFRRTGSTADSSSTTHIVLRNLPRSALPSDIRRLIANAKVENVADVALDYRRFGPTGKAWIELTNPNFVNRASRALNGGMVGGNLIEATPAKPFVEASHHRVRGVKGRLEAAERGLITGNGPAGGVKDSARGVVIWGLPGKMTPDSLKDYLKNFKLAGLEAGKVPIIKLEVADAPKFALRSRHYVCLASVSEAHRLVRKLHMTFYRPEVHGERYSLRAHVVY